ncbi:MAG: DUF4249 family protein [Bacillota bacterium]
MNSNKIKTALIFILCLYLSACENPADNPGILKKFSVLALLKSGSPEQKITVYRTSTLSEKDYNTNAFFVSDAKVFISDSMDYNVRYAFRSKDYNKYYTNLQKYSFLPGRKYYLEVQAGDCIIKGTTIFPGDFSIEYPKDKDTVLIKENDRFNLPVKWNKSQGAFGYIVEVNTIQKIDDGENVIESPWPTTFITRDNSINWSFYRPADNQYYKFLTTQITVSVTAFDKNYYDHHYEMYTSAGLKGAYGYFASGITKTVKLDVK